MAPIGENIRIQRTIKGYSQQYMAYALDISQAAYSKMERNETELSIRRVFAIAEILEISPYVLMPKPKFGTSIDLRNFLHTIYKIRRLWNKNISRKISLLLVTTGTLLN
ncbi:helix-turn-helix domain-containing protein [Mucilaginibacter sp. OK283]|jgi:transcriptional regulator with XRE-family HTH domain|uniref:helix-turn-helix domain-containing protein n=1 Tax=Mucilaginibacter sp. OK283 TaxID=1881049 RepID=UPI0008D81A15|nr:helix-turn-helix transcriptional regulator [Mucilaginibacter sp. OK283]SEO79592.1 Helix-turn-helix [Mucilaginibacter sp. OK283]